MKWRKENNRKVLDQLSMELTLKEFYIHHVLLALIAENQSAWDLGCGKFNKTYFFNCFPLIKDRRTVRKYLDHLRDESELMWFEEGNKIYLFSYEVALVSVSWGEQTKKEKAEKPKDRGQLFRYIQEHFFREGAELEVKNANTMHDSKEKRRGDLQGSGLKTKDLQGISLKGSLKDHLQDTSSSRSKE